MTDRFKSGGALLVVFTAICSGTGIVLMKYGMGGEPLRIAFFLSGLAVYGIGIVCGIVLLGKYPISTVYPVVVGLSLVVVATISAIALGEAMTQSRLIGMALIVAGVFFLVRPQHSPSPR